MEHTAYTKLLGLVREEVKKTNKKERKKWNLN